MNNKYILLQNASVINVIDKAIDHHTDILIQGNTIVDVGKNLDYPQNIQIMDCSGKVAMPGMIDCHVHLDLGEDIDFPGKMLEEPVHMFVIRAVERLSRYLSAGFTTIRVNGGYEHLATSLRDAVKLGLVKGPRIVAAGKYLSITGGHGQFFKQWVKLDYSMVDFVDNPDEITKAIRTQIANNVDVIKFFNTGGVMDAGSNPNAQEFTDNELATIISEAKKAGKRTSTHAHGTAGIKSAVKAGVDSVEHSSILDEECVALMKEKGTFIVPTLKAVGGIVENGAEIGLPEYALAKARALADKCKQSFRMAYEAGINIAMGTDAGVPFNRHGDNAYELELMVKYGMSPADAIGSCTKKAAENLGIDDVTGSLEKGKAADIIIIDGNPLDDITILQDKKKINMVIKEGKIC